jgi:uncharacterized paraquat-inducible protein A
MEQLSRKERRLIQGTRDRFKRDKGRPDEFACCGMCDYLIQVYRDEDGPTKACPRCAWDRHVMGGSWGWRALANVGQLLYLIGN